MTTQELRELDAWIALNVTKTLRKLSDEEYAAIVAWCEEANKDPHPNLELTTPRRYEGSCLKYTSDPAAAMEVLEKCAKQVGNVIEIFGNNKDGWVVSGKNDAWESDADTLPLAICLFAKKLFTP